MSATSSQMKEDLLQTVADAFVAERGQFAKRLHLLEEKMYSILSDQYAGGSKGVDIDTEAPSRLSATVFSEEPHCALEEDSHPAGLFDKAASAGVTFSHPTVSVKTETSGTFRPSAESAKSALKVAQQGSTPARAAVSVKSADSGQTSTDMNGLMSMVQRRKQKLKTVQRDSTTTTDSSMPFALQQITASRGRWQDFADSKEVPQTRLARLVTSVPFRNVVFIMIVLNISFVAYESEVLMQDITRRDRTEAKIMEAIFTFAFVIELGLKLVGLQWFFITGYDWRWNLFDFVVVSLSVPALFGSSMNASFARVLRLARAVHMLEMVKEMPAFTDLRKIVIMMKGSVSVLIWVAATFLFCMLCFGIMIMQISVNYIGGWGSEDLAVAEELRSHYGTVSGTLLTLFHTISGGDWSEAAAPLGEIHGGYKYVFALYIFFMTFGLINVVIGLFCERAVEAVAGDRALRTLKEQTSTSEFAETLEAVFEEMDENNSGEIEWEGFNKYVSNDETGNFLRSHGIATHDAKGLFELLDGIDGDANGYMDIASFVLGMERIAGTAKGADMALAKLELQALRRDVRKIKTLIVEMPKFGSSKAKPEESKGERQRAATWSPKAAAASTDGVVLELGDPSSSSSATAASPYTSEANIPFGGQRHLSI